MNPQMIIRQIDDVLHEFTVFRARSMYEDCSDLPEVEISEHLTSLRATIERLAPPGSPYRESTKELLKTYGVDNGHLLTKLPGILSALKAAYSKGYLTTVQGLIRAELFSDFIEMADYLHGEGYKDPAAVIAGTVLEGHLRKLCVENGISIDNAGSPKKADQLNGELSKAEIYSKLDQKSVTAWLDLRNKAAHGKYSEYTKDQVTLLIQSIRDFLGRNPV